MKYCFILIFLLVSFKNLYFETVIIYISRSYVGFQIDVLLLTTVHDIWVYLIEMIHYVLLTAIYSNDIYVIARD